MSRTGRTAVATIGDLEALVGQEVGVSAWTTVDQQAIDAFADATRDHQWIHVDRERAAGESPFGSTIAHGFLILSLAPALTLEVFDLGRSGLPEGIKFGVNYGLDRVRFISPLPAGSHLRVRVTLLSVEKQEGGAKFTLRLAFERDGGDRPVAVADWIQRVYT